MAREKFRLLRVPCTVCVWPCSLPPLRNRAMPSLPRTVLSQLASSVISVSHGLERGMHSVKSVRYEQTVSYSELQKMPFVFPHVEYCDMHFVYGFCNGNALAAVQEYRRRFPDRRIPSSRVFTRIHQTLRDTGCLPSIKVRSER